MIVPTVITLVLFKPVLLNQENSATGSVSYEFHDIGAGSAENPLSMVAPPGHQGLALLMDQMMMSSY